MSKQRTNAQNAALHKYFELVADVLDREGHTMQDVLREVKRAEIRPTPEAIKEVVWKPLQEVMYGKKSTIELETHEVDRVYEAMNAFIGRCFGVYIPFPNNEPEWYAE